MEWSQVETRTCGASGLQLSALGSAAGPSAAPRGLLGSQDQRDADEVVARALDLGINYFDTAEGYNDGRSEESLGRALRGRRAEAVIGTKWPPEKHAARRAARPLRASLRRLNTDGHRPLHGALAHHDHPVPSFAT